CIMNDSVKKLLSVTDMCLLDYKMTNDEDYRKYTGCSLEKVESFLKELNDREIITRIRQVIVSGINDNEESIGRVYGLSDRYSCIKETELLRFRKLCIPKYENLGIPFPFKDIPETTEEQLQRLKR
ncbi:MAG: pyruvate formate-lyase 1-activating enzyme, partial [Ruminiclostridium sp.]